METICMKQAHPHKRTAKLLPSKTEMAKKATSELSIAGAILRLRDTLAFNCTRMEERIGSMRHQHRP